MAVGIYKQGQGYWTRTMSAIAFAVLTLMGVAWLWRLLATVRVGGLEPVYLQAASAILIIGIFGFVGYRLMGRSHRVVEFMIATEGEMKKVNWSTRREVMGSTWLVIGLTIFIALLCKAFDTVYQMLFQVAQVLET